MRDDDFVAVALCEQTGDAPVDWDVSSPIHFIKVADMRAAAAAEHIQITKPKGVEEGSEIRIIWSSTAAKEESVVTAVTETSIQLTTRSGGRKQTYRLKRRAFSLLPLCAVGDVIAQNRIVAATVPVTLNPTPDRDVGEEFFLERLGSASLSERYAAAKALRFRGYERSMEALRQQAQDPAEDIYVQLEAAAALAAHGDPFGWDFLTQSLDSQYLTIQLETVIVTSEIPDPQSEGLLIRVLTDANRDSEVRAGAAWALGEFKTQNTVFALVNTFNLTSLEIKIEAARALLKIAPSQIVPLIDSFKGVDSTKRDGIAWALAKAGGFNVTELLGNAADMNLRRWVSYIAGFGRENLIGGGVDELAERDPEVHFAASVLWQLLDSWVHGLEEY